MNPCCRFGDVVELDDIDHIKVDDIKHFAVLVVRNRNPVLEVLKYMVDGTCFTARSVYFRNIKKVLCNVYIYFRKIQYRTSHRYAPFKIRQRQWIICMAFVRLSVIIILMIVPLQVLLQHVIPFQSLQHGIPFHSFHCLKLQTNISSSRQTCVPHFNDMVTCIFRGQRSYATYSYKYKVDIYSLYKN